MFSVVIPLYNKSKYILRAIESVFAQSFQDWEIIVVDDGSLDDGYQKVKKINSEKIRLIKQKNSGVSASRNLAISKAKNPYIAFLDADDIWHKDYLSIMVLGIKEFPNAGLWASNFSYNLEYLKMGNGKFELLEDYFEKVIWDTMFFTSSVVMDKTFFLENEGFKTYLKRGEDLDVWFRSNCLNGHVAYCKDKLVLYERGDIAGATKTTFHLNASILNYILNDDYMQKEKISANQQLRFKIFKSKYIYLNIYKYLLDPENYPSIRSILKTKIIRYPPLEMMYKIPFPILTSVLKNRRGKNFFKKYIIFSLKYLCF